MKKNREAVQAAVQCNGELDEFDAFSDALLLKNINKKLRLQFKNDSQKQFWEIIGNNEITLCSGPAGTGKSYLAISKALQLLSNNESKFKRILALKPAYEAEEKLGALPGTVEEKLDPYTYSIRYIISKIIGQRRTDKLIERGLIEFTAVTYLRGVNIDDTIVLFDEAQNVSRKGIRTLLTRIGENSKFIVTGDVEQIDKPFAKGEESGLTFAIRKLKNIKGIGIFEFSSKDIVRNPIIGIILEQFNGDIK